MVNTILIIVSVCIIVAFIVIKSIEQSKINAYWKSREESAEMGDADAKFRFAESCANVCMKHKAFKWYKCAADLNHGDASYRLSMCYLLGLNVVEINQILAELCFTKAILLNSPRAYNHKGEYYRKGFGGLIQSNEEAFKCYYYAASQGLAAAQYNLGCCCRDGVGVCQSETESKKWFKLAADQGYDYPPLTFNDDPSCEMFSYSGCK
ncbi:MAG: tetratricopeptide repeat protein [Candidatus Cloacimonetes bacterium]|jgi:TPR repeat protein|nr:tetratricopeptide repeat protein [Candidatus Cloacimonadota bacterium]